MNPGFFVPKVAGFSAGWLPSGTISAKGCDFGQDAKINKTLKLADIGKNCYICAEFNSLFADYKAKRDKTLEDIIDLHQRFEVIHPFQDGNGRVGRLVLFKECLSNGIVPLIITEDLKLFYYRGLREWGHVNGYLTDTCLTAQDSYKKLLDYFKIKY